MVARNVAMLFVSCLQQEDRRFTVRIARVAGLPVFVSGTASPALLITVMRDVTQMHEPVCSLSVMGTGRHV